MILRPIEDWFAINYVVPSDILDGTGVGGWEGGLTNFLEYLMNDSFLPADGNGIIHIGKHDSSNTEK